MKSEQLRRAKAAQIELYHIALEAIESGDAERRRVALLLLDRLTPKSEERNQKVKTYRIKTPEIIQGLLWDRCIKSADGMNYFYFFENWEPYFTALIMLNRQRGGYRGALYN